MSDKFLLSDDEFNKLSSFEQDEYLQLLQEDLTAWSLVGNDRQMRANILLDKVDWLLYGGAAGTGMRLAGNTNRRPCASST